MAKRLKTYRVDGDLFDAAVAKAASEGETITDVLTRALQAYVNGVAPKTRGDRDDTRIRP